MKKSARILTILVALMMLSFAFAASASALKIGATYYSLQNEFTMRMDNAGKKYCEENGIEFLSYDGNYDAATQLAQVETMIADGCDAIILNPQDAIACAAAVELAHNAGIPVVGVNTMVESDLLTSYVGSQDVSAGEDIMNYMIKYLGKDAFNIVIIEGPMGQSAQLQRIEGITNVLANYPNIKELARNTANWSRSEAMSLMETWISTFGDEIDAVIAENDEMALGAREAIVAAGKDIPCIGIDGITDAVAAIQSGNMIASDFQNAEGQMTGAIEIAAKAVAGETVEKFYWIPFEMITPENAADYVGRY
ncbi:MAG: substrate-binding domain-containing protein [Christensenellaceae bacterium]|nr:substrate-binding domain-containing protein [Christensenellaceae bacterium]MEA5069138.1 substrate-binding domain-containing protein [Christensenellaceae bacterium]